jgi:tetratricopeptide (TPR) repeat protein
MPVLDPTAARSARRATALVAAAVVFLGSLGGNVGGGGDGDGPLAVRSARAQADTAESRARQKFKEGQAHFAAGRFREAANAYEAAYAAKPLPAFLFNLGQCYRNLDEPARAITYFKAYLLDARNAANRDSIQRTITELEAQMRARGASPPPAPAPTPAPSGTPPAAENPSVLPTPSSAAAAEGGATVTASAGQDTGARPIYKRWWFWTGVGVVVVAAVLGGVLGSRGGTADTGASLGDVHVPAR